MPAACRSCSASCFSWGCAPCIRYLSSRQRMTRRRRSRLPARLTAPATRTTTPSTRPQPKTYTRFPCSVCRKLQAFCPPSDCAQRSVSLRAAEVCHRFEVIYGGVPAPAAGGARSPAHQGKHFHTRSRHTFSRVRTRS